MRATLQLPKLLLASGAIGALPEELIQAGIHRPLLVTDRGIVDCGILAQVRGAVPGLNRIFDQVTENPVFADCDAAAGEFAQQGCDGIVALGGGSVIDAAKLTAVIAGQGGCAADYGGHSERITSKTVPLVAIPTTAGTGSEASAAAGVHPTSIERARGIGSPFIIPKLAICDPDLTHTLPPALTAATGIDAITHCIEGYLAITSAPIVDALALDGIGRIWKCLESAVRNGRASDARYQLMLAAFEGGVAITKGLGPAHAIAIACGDQGVHHGKLSALGLVASLELLADLCAPKLGDIAKVINLVPGASVREALLNLMRRVGLPDTLSAANYRIADLDTLASAAAATHFNATSPYKPTVAEYKTIIASIAG